MRKVLMLAVALTAMVTCAQAQQFRVGPTAGVSFGGGTELDVKTGFQLGAKGELYFDNAQKGWFADASLLLAKQTYAADTYKFGDQTANGLLYEVDNPVWQLRLPVNFGYKFNLAKNFKVFAAAGPYVSCGLAGKLKGVQYSWAANQQTNLREDIANTHHVYGKDRLNRFDWGVGAKVGFELFEHLQLAVGYERGFCRLAGGKQSPAFHKQHQSNSTALTVGAAYVF